MHFEALDGAVVAAVAAANGTDHPPTFHSFVVVDALLGLSLVLAAHHLRNLNPQLIPAQRGAQINVRYPFLSAIRIDTI